MTCREAGVGVYLPLETQDGADIALLLAALADAFFIAIASTAGRALGPSSRCYALLGGGVSTKLPAEGL